MDTHPRSAAEYSGRSDCARVLMVMVRPKIDVSPKINVSQ